MAPANLVLHATVLRALQAVEGRIKPENHYGGTFHDLHRGLVAVRTKSLMTDNTCWRVDLPDLPLHDVYYRNYVDAGVTGWDSFEPTLTKAEEADVFDLWRCAE